MSVSKQSRCAKTVFLKKIPDGWFRERGENLNESTELSEQVKRKSLFKSLTFTVRFKMFSQNSYFS